MGLFDGIKAKAIKDAKCGKKYHEKEPYEMRNEELERELHSSKSITEKKKYAEELLKRKGQ